VSKLNNAAGALLIIGGSEDHKGERKILAEFVRLAGGSDAAIVIITVASEVQSEVGSRYSEVFTQLGVREVRALDALSPYAKSYLRNHRGERVGEVVAAFELPQKVER